MKARFVAALVISVTIASNSTAQTPNTCASGVTQDACQMAIDVAQYMGPQLGLALTGGNATLGQGGALGGLGHFTVGLRANVFNGSLPQIDQFPIPSVTGRQVYTLPTDGQILGLPVVDAAIGIFKGLPLGLTNVGGIDLLLSANYIPKVGGSDDDFQVSPKSNLKIGYGARVGLLQESLLVPGVSVTWLKRDLPTTTLRGQDATFDFTLSDMKVNTNSWRVVASKSLVVFGIALGAGQDRYDESADVQASVGGATGNASFAQKMTRTNVFADLSMNLALIKIVGEIGQVSGGTVTTYSSFEGKAADASRVYGSVGLRVGF